MHHDASRDALPSTFIKVTCKGQAWGAASIVLQEIHGGMCEAREHGHDSKQRHQVEGPIMQAKEWMRDFGCNLWSTRARKSQSGDHHARGKPNQGRHETTQAGRPPLGCLQQASNSSLSLFVCSKFLVQNLLKLSHPSQVGFAQQKSHP
jgi:hypothetical protein